MVNKKLKRTALIISVFSILSGCTINGHDEFSCPDPENGVCLPADEAYIAAEQGKEASDYHKNNSDEYEDYENEDGEVQKRSKYSDIAPVVGLMSQPISQPKPILQPASVLLAWVNQWEDEYGVFHMPQTAFVEITPRRWSQTDTSISKFKSISPFQMVSPITNTNQTSN